MCVCVCACVCIYIYIYIYTVINDTTRILELISFRRNNVFLRWKKLISNTQMKSVNLKPFYPASVYKKYLIKICFYFKEYTPQVLLVTSSVMFPPKSLGVSGLSTLYTFTRVTQFVLISYQLVVWESNISRKMT